MEQIKSNNKLSDAKKKIKTDEPISERDAEKKAEDRVRHVIHLKNHNKKWLSKGNYASR